MKPQNAAKAARSRGERHKRFQRTQRGQDPKMCQGNSSAKHLASIRRGGRYLHSPENVLGN